MNHSTPTPKSLTRRREQMAMTKHNLAERLGVTYQSVYNWEAGKNKIPVAIDLAVDQLVHLQTRS